MSKLTSLEALLKEEIKDIYSAETQLVKALPKMAKAASDAKLREAFEAHLKETETHVERLEEVAKLLEIKPTGKVCKAMKGLVEEGAEAIEEDGEPAIKDLALIGAAQRVEHYEIAAYGTCKAMATALGLKDIAKLLDTTEQQEGKADKKLTSIAEAIMAGQKV